MSLTTVKEPGTLCFSKNPIWWRFLSGNYRTTLGAKAKCEILFDSIYAGITFDISFNGKTYTLYCDSTPDGTGYEFRDYIYQPQFDLMIEDFKALYELNKHFTITKLWVGGTLDKMILEAKESGSKWNVSISGGSGRITLNNITTGTDDVYNPNYKVFVDLHKQLDQTVDPVENQIAQLDADAHKDDIVVALATNEYAFDFELQDLLHAQLTPYVPAWNENTIKKATGMMLNYWLRIGEIYGEDPKVLWNDYNGLANSYKKAVIGGLPLDEYTLSILPNYTTTAFLNRQPTTKAISKTCQEYLYKYLATAQTTLQLWCTITYTDGTTWAGKVGNSLASSLAQEIYVFPSGWTALNLNSYNPSKTPVKYTVHVTNAATGTLSDSQTYILDLQNYESNSRLLFLGACGAMETVWCTGYTQEVVESDGQPITGPRLPWYERGNHILKNSNSRQNIRYKFNTGYKSLTYINWLKELAHSDVVLLAENGYWTSIRIDKKSIKDLPTALDDLYAISFEAERMIHP